MTTTPEEAVCRLVIPAAVRAQFERGGMAASGYNDLRRWPRVRAYRSVLLEYLPSLPALARPAERHAALLVSMSRGGSGLLHGEQLFPHERIRLAIEPGKSFVVEIAYCRKLDANCYLAGGEFK